ncbi:MAG: diaminopimelate decarboxylase [Bdellovibrionales bacterium]|nr:diaminopimelate decarboxylase [Bdellovibrionales bacterium]
MTLDSDLALELSKKYHTPLYVIEESVIRRQCRKIKNALVYPNSVVRYACKALSLISVLEIVREEGLWIDVVSYNEMLRAKRAGFRADQILYTGEGGSPLVFERLIQEGVTINCSSLDHLRLLGRLRAGSTCSVRINPGQGHGHGNKVNTGGPASKHGIYHDQIPDILEIARECDLKISGVHAHIGSGTDLEEWLRISELTFSFAANFKDLQFIDLGGGFPVVYNPAVDKPMLLERWGREISQKFTDFCKAYGRPLQLQIEPGRFCVAESGYLLAEVQAVKRTPDYNFVIVNSGLNHNPRPMMYGSYHPIEFVSLKPRVTDEMVEYVVGGYLCESGDVFTVSAEGVPQPRKFKPLDVGDLMIMGNAGAYCHSMKSEYNSMNLPAVVLVKEDGSQKVIERRSNFDDLIKREVDCY